MSKTQRVCVCLCVPVCARVRGDFIRRSLTLSSHVKYRLIRCTFDSLQCSRIICCRREAPVRSLSLSVSGSLCVQYAPAGLQQHTDTENKQRAEE